MARTATRLYVPLDVGFFDDARVVDAGEKAAWLYLNMLSKAKGLDSDGVLTRQQIGRLGVSGWQARLRTLVAVGLVVERPDGYSIGSWLKWNESAQARADRLADDRRRKAEKLEAIRAAESQTLKAVK